MPKPEIEFKDYDTEYEWRPVEGDTLGIKEKILSSDPVTGAVLSEERVHNLIVTSGKVLVTRMLEDESGWDTGITFCDVGTDNVLATILRVFPHEEIAIRSTLERSTTDLRT